MRSTHFRIPALAAITALTLAACGGDDGDGGEEGSDLPFGDSITIGTKIDQPGTGIQIEGEYQGMDVDVAREVASRLGYEEDDISWQESPTPQREDMLVNGTVDMIAATYSITDERKERVQFAGPYFVAGQDLLVKNDSDIQNPEDLDGRTLCSVAGSTPAERVSENYPGVELQEYDTYSLCVEALASGAVDALTTDDTILAGYASQDTWSGQFRVVGQPFSEELYGVGIPQDDTELCQQVNDALTELYDDGSMDTIISDNFGPADYTPAAGTNPPEVGGHCAD